MRQSKPVRKSVVKTSKGRGTRKGFQEEMKLR